MRSGMMWSSVNLHDMLGRSGRNGSRLREGHQIEAFLLLAYCCFVAFCSQPCLFLFFVLDWSHSSLIS